MLNRKIFAVTAIACAAAAALTLSVAAAPAQAKTTVIGQTTYHNTGFFDGVAILPVTKTVKKPKRNSITITVDYVPDNPLYGNLIDVAGTVYCKKKKDPVRAYSIGGEFKGVAPP